MMPISSRFLFWFWPLLFLSAVGHALALGNSFPDVPLEHPYQQAIEYVVERGFISPIKATSFGPYHTVRRNELAHIVVEMNFPEAEIEACPIEELDFKDFSRRTKYAKYLCMAVREGLMKGYRDQTLKPQRPVTLAETAQILVKVFDLQAPPHESLPWYAGPIKTLEQEKAIPASFFSVHEKVTRSELAEMVYRLSEVNKDQPSRTYDELERFQYGDKKEFLRFWGALGQDIFPASLLKQTETRLFSQPAGYAFYDEDEFDPYDGCKMYVTDSVEVTTSGNHFEAQLNARSGQACEVVDPDFDPERCRQPEPGVYCACTVVEGLESCQRLAAKEHNIALVKEDGSVRIEGANGHRLKIIRRALGKIPFEYGSSGPFYEYTGVPTEGNLTTQALSDGRTLSIYRTAWHPVFSDLRGVAYLKIERDLPNGGTFQKLYEAPEHNRNPYGKGNASYDRCLEKALSPYGNYDFQFCMKREGEEFVVASYLELGDSMTLWIDEHFKR